MVCFEFVKDLIFTEDLPITKIDKADFTNDVIVIHCKNGFILSINEESLCVWKDKESCYFYREDGEWNPLLQMSFDDPHSVVFSYWAIDRDPPQRMGI
jgi:hypothetical protein